MKDPLLSLASDELRQLASALEAGRLTPPYSAVGLQRFVGHTIAADVADSLSEIAADGCGPAALARFIRLLAAESDQHPRLEDVVQLVATGPTELDNAPRPTSVVVSSLFREAEKSVVVVGYAVYQGQKVFRDLADRMTECPGLNVRLYLDIQRRDGDTSTPEEIVRRFCDRFRTTQWPAGKPIPEVYYDPRSAAVDRSQAAALHAKCVIVDGHQLFISSANFTEAAQQRNIEMGLLLKSATLASTISEFLQRMIRANVLQKAF